VHGDKGLLMEIMPQGTLAKLKQGSQLATIIFLKSFNNGKTKHIAGANHIIS